MGRLEGTLQTQHIATLAADTGPTRRPAPTSPDSFHGRLQCRGQTRWASDLVAGVHNQDRETSQKREREGGKEGGREGGRRGGRRGGGEGGREGGREGREGREGGRDLLTRPGFSWCARTKT